MQKRWMLRRRRIDENILKKYGVSDIVLSILANRGIVSEHEVKDFLNPSIDKMFDPFMMKDMDRGTDIIADDLKKGNKIAIYGDYDADGVTSTYILYKGLLNCGADVIYHIPDRIKEGYGMNVKSVYELEGCGVRTILTCDNGISAKNEIDKARELGMKVIVTDHHDVPFCSEEGCNKKYVIPDADAVVNPKQQDCKYPFKMLCGAGVAFKFIQALYIKLGRTDNIIHELMQFAAIGTICDVVDLVGENRIIAKFGLDEINSTENTGMKCLIEQNSLKPGSIKAYHVGFVLGPCINAAGRLESAQISLELFMEKDLKRAEVMAKHLRELNLLRQEMTLKSTEDIVKAVETSNMKNDRVIVAYKEGMHESIAGIVAGKIKEKYNLPSIVLTDGEAFAKGSGRSIDEYDMFYELTKCSRLMENFGGHKMAAGMSIKKENIEKLRVELNKNCSLKDCDIVPKIIIDHRLALDSISLELINSLKCLEPFGKANPSPVFAEKNIEVFAVHFMGENKNTVKFSCRLKKSVKKMDALSFDGGERFRKIAEKHHISNNSGSIFMDMVFSPSVNDYRGVKSVQIIVKDFRLSI